MPVPDLFTANRVRRRVTVRGVVQGVGFRPHVYALARSLHLSGAVWNTGDGVVVEIEGAPGGAEAFTSRVRAEAPPLALVSDVEVEEIELQGGTEFVIRESEQAAGRTFVAPDVTICDDCLADLRDPGNRRFRHPFVTCTNCGPRYTITTGLPYDRPATTMAGFAMCAACAAEYADPADRRFHAQTVCCPDCGPRLSLVAPAHTTTYGEVALAEARAILREGGDRRGQGHRRLPPGLRRDQRLRRGDVAQAQAARGQAVRGDGHHARRRAAPRRPHPGRGRPADQPRPPDRAGPATPRRPGGGRRARPGRSRRDARLRAAAPPAARPARRRARAARHW